MIEKLRTLTAKDYLAYAAVLALCLGFVWSRSMYSFGLLFMGLYWVTDVKITAYLWKNVWFLSSLILALLVPVSDFINGASMSQVFFIKLSIPLFAVFFASIKKNHINVSVINIIVIVTMLVTACITIMHFLADSSAVNESYKYAKVMSIGKYSDHIRISTAIACSIFMAIYEYSQADSKFAKAGFILYIIGQSIFLHILAARTGLVMLYASMIIYAFYTLINQRKKWPLAIITSLVLLPIISFYIFPSFYYRVGFTVYEKEFYQKMEYREGSSDGLRYYSMVGGLDIYKQHTCIGIGYNQLPQESSKWLKNKFPMIKESEMIQPSSQYILVMAASGTIGLLVMLIFFFAPYFNAENRRNPYFLAINTSMLCIMIFEIFLENQYGCFVFCFFIGLIGIYPNANKSKESKFLRFN
jgi:O-antigen ligase